MVGGRECVGSVRVGSYSWKEFALRDIIVTSPEHLGSHVVLKAKSISLHPSWSIFKGVSSVLQHQSPLSFVTELCAACTFAIPSAAQEAAYRCMRACRSQYGAQEFFHAAGEPLNVVVDRPWVNGLMDDLGQLHLLLLLQVSLRHAFLSTGYFKSLKVFPSNSVC